MGVASPASGTEVIFTPAPDQVITCGIRTQVSPWPLPDHKCQFLSLLALVSLVHSSFQLPACASAFTFSINFSRNLLPCLHLLWFPMLNPARQVISGPTHFLRMDVDTVKGGNSNHQAGGTEGWKAKVNKWVKFEPGWGRRKRD